MHSEDVTIETRSSYTGQRVALPLPSWVHTVREALIVLRDAHADRESGVFHPPISSLTTATGEPITTFEELLAARRVVLHAERPGYAQFLFEDEEDDEGTDAGPSRAQSLAEPLLADTLPPPRRRPSPAFSSAPTNANSRSAAPSVPFMAQVEQIELSPPETPLRSAQQSSSRSPPEQRDDPSHYQNHPNHISVDVHSLTDVSDIPVSGPQYPHYSHEAPSTPNETPRQQSSSALSPRLSDVWMCSPPRATHQRPANVPALRFPPPAARDESSGTERASTYAGRPSSFQKRGPMFPPEPSFISTPLATPPESPPPPSPSIVLGRPTKGAGLPYGTKSVAAPAPSPSPVAQQQQRIYIPKTAAIVSPAAGMFTDPSTTQRPAVMVRPLSDRMPTEPLSDDADYLIAKSQALRKAKEERVRQRHSLPPAKVEKENGAPVISTAAAAAPLQNPSRPASQSKDPSPSVSVGAGGSTRPPSPHDAWQPLRSTATSVVEGAKATRPRTVAMFAPVNDDDDEKVLPATKRRTSPIAPPLPPPTSQEMLSDRTYLTSNRGGTEKRSSPPVAPLNDETQPFTSSSSTQPPAAPVALPPPPPTRFWSAVLSPMPSSSLSTVAPQPTTQNRTTTTTDEEEFRAPREVEPQRRRQSPLLQQVVEAPHPRRSHDSAPNSPGVPIPISPERQTLYEPSLIPDKASNANSAAPRRGGHHPHRLNEGRDKDGATRGAPLRDTERQQQQEEDEEEAAPPEPVFGESGFLSATATPLKQMMVSPPPHHRSTGGGVERDRGVAPRAEDLMRLVEAPSPRLPLSNPPPPPPFASPSGSGAAAPPPTTMGAAAAAAVRSPAGPVVAAADRDALRTPTRRPPSLEPLIVNTPPIEPTGIHRATSVDPPPPLATTTNDNAASKKVATAPPEQSSKIAKPPPPSSTIYRPKDPQSSPLLPPPVPLPLVSWPVRQANVAMCVKEVASQWQVPSTRREEVMFRDTIAEAIARQDDGGGGAVPRCLFTGPPRSGKTTTAWIALQDYYQVHWEDHGVRPLLVPLLTTGSGLSPSPLSGHAQSASAATGRFIAKVTSAADDSVGDATSDHEIAAKQLAALHAHVAPVLTLCRWWLQSLLTSLLFYMYSKSWAECETMAETMLKHYWWNPLLAMAPFTMFVWQSEEEDEQRRRVHSSSSSLLAVPFDLVTPCHRLAELVSQVGTDLLTPTSRSVSTSLRRLVQYLVQGFMLELGTTIQPRLGPIVYLMDAVEDCLECLNAAALSLTPAPSRSTSPAAPPPALPVAETTTRLSSVGILLMDMLAQSDMLHVGWILTTSTVLEASGTFPPLLSSLKSQGATSVISTMDIVPDYVAVERYGLPKAVRVVGVHEESQNGFLISRLRGCPGYLQVWLKLSARSDKEKGENRAAQHGAGHVAVLQDPRVLTLLEELATSFV